MIAVLVAVPVSPWGTEALLVVLVAALVDSLA